MLATLPKMDILPKLGLGDGTSDTESAPVRCTTGRIEMWNGTKDGKEAYLDTSKGFETNLNPKKIHQVDIYDIRYQSPAPQLLNNGYEVTCHPSAVSEGEIMTYKTNEGRELIKSKYWPEVQRLLEWKTNADLVIPWHFSVRSQTLSADYHPDKVVMANTGVSQPAATIHVDNDHVTALNHLQREVGEERAAELTKQYPHWAIINTWRPVGTPVQRWPLLVVDTSEVENFSFEENIGRVYREHGSAYYKPHDNFLKPNENYTFRYASNLRPDEVIIFRDYDSRSDKFYGCPHGGFQDDATKDDAPARRSIEVRCFVFFKE